MHEPHKHTGTVNSAYARFHVTANKTIFDSRVTLSVTDAYRLSHVFRLHRCISISGGFISAIVINNCRLNINKNLCRLLNCRQCLFNLSSFCCKEEHTKSALRMFKVSKLIEWLVVLLGVFSCISSAQPQSFLIEKSESEAYDPTWESLDKRPLPLWYDQAKVGIFIHWGVYSVPSFGSEWFWTNWRNAKNEAYVNFMNRNYKPGFTYQEFAHDFTAEHFNPVEWAKLFEDSGAK